MAEAVHGDPAIDQRVISKVDGLAAVLNEPNMWLNLGRPALLRLREEAIVIIRNCDRWYKVRKDSQSTKSQEVKALNRRRRAAAAELDAIDRDIAKRRAAP